MLKKECEKVEQLIGFFVHQLSKFAVSKTLLWDKKLDWCVCEFKCYKSVHSFRVNCLFSGQYNTEGYGTITDLI